MIANSNTNTYTHINNLGNIANNKTIKLLDYQREHFTILKRALENHSRAIDASDTGTGKTPVAVKLCVELNLIPWVICPKSVISPWIRTIESAGIVNYYVGTYEKLYASQKFVRLNNSDEFVWQFDSHPELMSNQKYLFIYDEAHKCKNLDTLNCKILLSLSKLNVKILLLSATIIDKPSHFIPFGIVLKLYSNYIEGNNWMSDLISTQKNPNLLLAVHNEIFGKYASRMRIDDTHGIFKNNVVYWEGIQMNNYWEIDLKYDKINLLLEQKKLDKINKKKSSNSNKSNKFNFVESDGSEENIEQLELNELNEPNEPNEPNKPNKPIELIDLNNLELVADDIINLDEPTNKIKKIKKNNKIDKIDKIDELVDKIEDDELPDNLGKKNYTLARLTMLRMEIELLRVDKIIEMTNKFIRENKSVVIFVNYVRTITELAERLNCNCIIWGKQTLKERTDAIDNFCSDKSRIIICNIQSGSAGISLHDTIGIYPRISIISPTWSAQDLLQSLGRIHRAMGKTNCEQYIIYCKGTVEESVGNVIKNKINNIRSFNDGRKKLKNDNMENILKTDLTRKKKIQEINEYIYKTNDFDSIQSRILRLENSIQTLNKELKTYPNNSNNFKECTYRINKVQMELDFNLKKMNESISLLMTNDFN